MTQFLSFQGQTAFPGIQPATGAGVFSAGGTEPNASTGAGQSFANFLLPQTAETADIAFNSTLSPTRNPALINISTLPDLTGVLSGIAANTSGAAGDGTTQTDLANGIIGDDTLSGTIAEIATGDAALAESVPSDGALEITFSFQQSAETALSGVLADETADTEAAQDTADLSEDENAENDDSLEINPDEAGFIGLALLPDRVQAGAFGRQTGLALDGPPERQSNLAGSNAGIDGGSRARGIGAGLADTGLNALSGNGGGNPPVSDQDAETGQIFTPGGQPLPANASDAAREALQNLARLSPGDGTASPTPDEAPPASAPNSAGNAPNAAEAESVAARLPDIPLPAAAGATSPAQSAASNAGIAAQNAVQPSLVNQPAQPESLARSGQPDEIGQSGEQDRNRPSNGSPVPQNSGRENSFTGASATASDLSSAQQLAQLIGQSAPTSGDASLQTGQIGQPLALTPTPPATAPAATYTPQALAQFAPSALPPETLPSLTAELSRGLSGGGDSFNIQLNPSELGRVDVRLLTNDDGSISTRIVVERSETLDFFQRDLRGLERALQQSGLRLSSDGIDLSLRDNGANNGGNNNSASGYNPGGDANERGRGSQNNAAGSATGSPIVVDDTAPNVPSDIVQTIYARFAPGRLNIEV